ncbi:MAG: ATP-binding cassette domain-containing protein, partial [bacterium]|nr:ATP-binding cassette domain-containing protein [Candidatus Aquidulcis sp.]
MSESIAPAAVHATGIGRVFQAKGGPVTALDGIDLRIEPGELFGVLGPNGAGKSTLIKILSTLLLPSTGSASIFGLDVVTETARVRRIMNLVAGGDFSGYGLLTVR